MFALLLRLWCHPSMSLFVLMGSMQTDQQEGGRIVLVTQVSVTYLASSRRVVVVALSLRPWNMGVISASCRKGRAISFRMCLYVGLSVR